MRVRTHAGLAVVTLPALLLLMTLAEFEPLPAQENMLSGPMGYTDGMVSGGVVVDPPLLAPSTPIGPIVGSGEPVPLLGIVPPVVDWEAPIYYNSPRNGWRFYFELGGMYLNRSKPEERELVTFIDRGVQDPDTGAFDGTFAPIRTVTSEVLDYDWSGGIRGVLTAELNGQTRAELIYFGLNEWKARLDVQAQTDRESEVSFLSFARPEFGTFVVSATDETSDEPPQAQTFENRSETHNVELNIRRLIRQFGPTVRLEVLGGLRYFNFQDTLNFDALYAGGEIEATRVLTHNHIFGVQAGVILSEQFGPVSLGGFLKGGLNANIAKLKVYADNSELGSFVDFQVIDTSDQSAQFSGMVETGIVGQYNFNSYLAIKAGYQFLVFTDAAQAVDQLAPTFYTTGLTLTAENELYFHGIFVSAEANY